MTKVLKAIVLVISALLLTLPAFAQEAPGGQMKQEPVREQVKQESANNQASGEVSTDPVKPEPAKTEAGQGLAREQAKPEPPKDQESQEAAKGAGTQEQLIQQSPKEPARDAAKEAARKEQSKGLDEQVQEIKTDVLRIATELNRLEEKLLYPSDTQIAIFVSVEGKEKYRLDAVDIELDGKAVAHHLYTFKELEALQKGGVQRIHVGNIRTGEHPLRVTVSGKTSGGSDFQKQESFKITKGIGPKLVGVVLAGTGIGSKRITVKDW